MPCKRVKINELFHEQLWNEMNGFIMCYSRIWSLELPQFSHLQHLNCLLSLYRCYCSERWSPVHMNIPELSSFFKLSECLLKTRKISAYGVRKINLIERVYNIIFLAPLADICCSFKKKSSLNFGAFFHKTRLNILGHFASLVNVSWFKNVTFLLEKYKNIKLENIFLSVCYLKK